MGAPKSEAKYAILLKVSFCNNVMLKLVRMKMTVLIQRINLGQKYANQNTSSRTPKITLTKTKACWPPKLLCP